MATEIVLFTRDLRVHDNPALAAATGDADQVVPLFVLDDRVGAAGYLAPNRARFLVDSLRALDAGLQERGGRLIVRSGDVVDVAVEVARETGARTLHVAADVSRFAQRRARDLEVALNAAGVGFEQHDGVTVVAPGALTTTSGGTYRVFTPYWNVWREARLREVVPAPRAIDVPDGVQSERLPEPGDLAAGDASPELMAGGEHEARRRLDAWLDAGIDDYEDGRDRLAEDGTSRLSPHLHFGTLSPREVVARLDLRRRGHEPFLRQLCWRDFHHQVTWSHPTMAVEELRSQGDRWDDDPAGEAFTAWKQARTGYPVVDAGMRQLYREGWMHNRARMVVASFLVKDLYVDWRLGAAHFLHWLVDGDLANNSANWQWIAGTGTDSRPNRVYNPTRQAERYDPEGAYVRQHVPELTGLDGKAAHTPWLADGTLFTADGYPPPLVDHAEAVARFRDARGLD